MKLGPVTKLEKGSKSTPKNLAMTLFRKIVTSLPFFKFTVNLEQSESRIPDAKSVKFIFSLSVTIYLIKTENRTKKSLTHVSHY